MASARLILASTSRYRKELLSRLRIPFDTDAPNVDESPLAGEAPAATARRLAQAKALVVAIRHPDAVVIGSDQVAELDGIRLDKPGSAVRAVEQLMAASGRTVEFLTAVHVCSRNGPTDTHAVVPTRVTFRRFDRAVAERYVAIEQPLDCAGSAKAEGLGIALIATIEGPDPTALIGLPLITVTDLLARHGMSVLDAR
jgi:septum formation protein